MQSVCHSILCVIALYPSVTRSKRTQLVVSPVKQTVDIHCCLEQDKEQFCFISSA